MSALIGKAHVFPGFERCSQQQLQRAYLQYTLQKFNSRTFFRPAKTLLTLPKEKDLHGDHIE